MELTITILSYLRMFLFTLKVTPFNLQGHSNKQHDVETSESYFSMVTPPTNKPITTTLKRLSKHSRTTLTHART